MIYYLHQKYIIITPTVLILTALLYFHTPDEPSGGTIRRVIWFDPLQCFLGSEGHVALDRSHGPGYYIVLLPLIPGDL